MEQSTNRATNQELQGNLSAVQESDSNQRRMVNVEGNAKLVTQVVKVHIDTEMPTQELNERVNVNSNSKPMEGEDNQNNVNAIKVNESASANSVNKLIDDKDSLINDSVVELNQEGSDLKNREDKEISKNPDMEQASPNNTQCHTLGRIDETRRISTRNKKTTKLKDK
jgi:hypothetical protein